MGDGEDGLLAGVHESMMGLIVRGFVLPIRWVLASYVDDGLIAHGFTFKKGTTRHISSAADDAAVLAQVRLPAHIVAIDANGQSITGVLPEEDDGPIQN
jgi:hypothetical protein